MNMPDEWKPLARRTYRHNRWRAIEEVDFELPSGDTETFALKKEGRVVTVFPLTPDERVVCARQFRPGPERLLDELPAGGVESGEQPVEAAARELREETGYRAERFISLGRMFECAYSTVHREAFIALDCRPHCEQELDRLEDIEVVEKPIPEYFEQLRAGLSSDLEVGWAALVELGFLTPDWG
jgi:ADP-ribose pyrophosphatase